mmetsp:Transcript_49260/g.127039  ORF Transcript_49260/g.127039 Transcript_49260/m.127039 type:complete len:91 (-) Transcript_49260:32-304(-)
MKAAAAALVGLSPASSSSAGRVLRRQGYDDVHTINFFYQTLESYWQQEFLDQVGCLPGGTLLHTAGNPADIRERGREVELQHGHVSTFAP